MIGFRCECGAAIDCTYPKCKEGVETNGKDITKRLQDYARDYTSTTYHDDLICEAVAEIESLRDQVTLLRGAMEAVWQDGYGFCGAEGLTDAQKQFQAAFAATELK